jgi:hypothetical protein
MIEEDIIGQSYWYMLRACHTEKKPRHRKSGTMLQTLERQTGYYQAAHLPIEGCGMLFLLSPAMWGLTDRRLKHCGVVWASILNL